MFPEAQDSVSAALPAIVVIALSSIAAIAIAAWLVREVARRAIDKTTPEDVASVVHELGALLNPLRLFLPWAGLKHLIAPKRDAGDLVRASLQNGTDPEVSEENTHEA